MTAAKRFRLEPLKFLKLITGMLSDNATQLTATQRIMEILRLSIRERMTSLSVISENPTPVGTENLYRNSNIRFPLRARLSELIPKHVFTLKGAAAAGKHAK